MKKLLTTTALTVGLALAPMHATHASDIETSELGKWCEQDAATLTICIIGGLAAGAVILAVADAASSDGSSNRSYSSSDEPVSIIGGNASPETHSPDPTPEFSLPVVEPQYDEDEQGLAWGSRKYDTDH